MKSVKVVFMAVKIAAVFGVAFLSFTFCDMFIATMITLFALLAMTMQHEQTESEWLDYVHELDEFDNNSSREC
jgi:hypothetical protein